MLILQPGEQRVAEKNTVTIAVIQQATHLLLLLQRNPDAYQDYVDPFPLF